MAAGLLLTWLLFGLLVAAHRRDLCILAAVGWSPRRLVRLLVAVPGIEEVALTTNGLLLSEQASGLASAGLGRLNVSLDTLHEEIFERLARRKGLDCVLAGLAAAYEMFGWSPSAAALAPTLAPVPGAPTRGPRALTDSTAVDKRTSISAKRSSTIAT